MRLMWYESRPLNVQSLPHLTERMRLALMTVELLRRSEAHKAANDQIAGLAFYCTHVVHAIGLDTALGMSSIISPLLVIEAGHLPTFLLSGYSIRTFGALLLTVTVSMPGLGRSLGCRAGTKAGHQPLLLTYTGRSC